MIDDATYAAMTKGDPAREAVLDHIQQHGLQSTSAIFEEFGVASLGAVEDPNIRSQVAAAMRRGPATDIGKFKRFEYMTREQLAQARLDIEARLRAAKGDLANAEWLGLSTKDTAERVRRLQGAMQRLQAAQGTARRASQSEHDRAFYGAAVRLLPKDVFNQLETAARDAVATANN